MDLDLRSKITARIEVSEEAMDTTEDPQDADDIPKDPEVPPTPIDADKLDHVFGSMDVRDFKFNKRRNFIGKNIEAFRDIHTPCTGTKELPKFLQDQTIPWAVLK